MVEVKKKDGTIEDFVESKIVAGVKRAGATAEQAGRVAKEVAEKVVRKTEVTAEGMSDMVVTSLKKG